MAREPIIVTYGPKAVRMSSWPNTGEPDLSVSSNRKLQTRLLVPATRILAGALVAALLLQAGGGAFAAVTQEDSFTGATAGDGLGSAVAVSAKTLWPAESLARRAAALGG